MMTPTDFVKILTAVTPIVATLTPLFRDSEKYEKKEEAKEPVNVTINNNFYTNSKEEAIEAAREINNLAVYNMYPSKTRYTL